LESVFLLKEVPLTGQKRLRDDHKGLRDLRDSVSQQPLPQKVEPTVLDFEKNMLGSPNILCADKWNRGNMALFGTFLRTPSKVDPFTLCNNTRLDSYLICTSSSQGVLSSICRNAFSTTPRVAATVSAKYIMFWQTVFWKYQTNFFIRSVYLDCFILLYFLCNFGKHAQVIKDDDRS